LERVYPIPARYSCNGVALLRFNTLPDTMNPVNREN
jgi:hypothetical protein